MRCAPYSTNKVCSLTLNLGHHTVFIINITLTGSCLTVPSAVEKLNFSYLIEIHVIPPVSLNTRTSGKILFLLNFKIFIEEIFFRWHDIYWHIGWSTKAAVLVHIRFRAVFWQDNSHLRPIGPGLYYISNWLKIHFLFIIKSVVSKLWFTRLISYIHEVNNITEDGFLAVSWSIDNFNLWFCRDLVILDYWIVDGIMRL